MFRPSLLALPTELLHNIAFTIVAADPLGPPRELLPLLLTSKACHAAFSADTLLAAICRLKFDTGAITRRAFTPYTPDLAEQLIHACTLLRAIRERDVHSIDTPNHLFTAYMFMLDNDGKNFAQLEWAGLGAYVRAFVRQRLWDDCMTNEGWPVDVAQNACALWLMWMTTTREELLSESLQAREELVLAILPFAVLPQRYAAAEAPPNHFHLPLSPSNPLHQSPFPSLERRPTQYPHYLDPGRSENQVHFRARPQLAPPLASVAAKLLFVARREVFPIRVPPTLPPGLTVEDYAELNRGKAAELPRGARWDWEAGRARAVNVEEGASDRVDGEESKKWDTEWWRRRLCYDYMAPRPRFTPGLVFNPGCMRGQWQGRIYIPQGNLFHQILHSPVYPGLADEQGYFSERSLGLVMQPVFLNIREHHRICGCPMGGCLRGCGPEEAGAAGASSTYAAGTSSTTRVESVRAGSTSGSAMSASSLPEATGCGIIPVPAPARVRFVRPVAAQPIANAAQHHPQHPTAEPAPLLQDEEPALDDEDDDQQEHSQMHANVHTVDTSLHARNFPDRIDMSMANAWLPGALGGVSALVREAPGYPLTEEEDSDHMEELAEEQGLDDAGGEVKDGGRTKKPIRRRDEVVFGVDYVRGDYGAVGACPGLGGTMAPLAAAESASSSASPPPTMSSSSSSTSSTSTPTPPFPPPSIAMPSPPSTSTPTSTPPSSKPSRPSASYVYETYDPARASSHNPKTCMRCAEWEAARAQERKTAAERARCVLERLMSERGGVPHEETQTEELDVRGLKLDVDVRAAGEADDDDEGIDGDEGMEDGLEEEDERMDVLGDDLPSGQPPVLGPDGRVLFEATRREFDRERIGVKGGCCGGVRDVLLTGETDPRHAAWHQQQYTIYGRVRPWDGLIGILRVGNVPSVNYLFISGYLVGERNFVGEWRVAHADPMRPTWGCAVVMSRREEQRS